jgi:hypothetical protein
MSRKPCIDASREIHHIIVRGSEREGIRTGKVSGKGEGAQCLVVFGGG